MSRTTLPTPEHLYQPTHYSAPDGERVDDIAQAIHGRQRTLSLDTSAILSILAFNYPCGDRTLFREFRRQPWLSSLPRQGAPVLQAVPPHGFLWDDSRRIARQLSALLQAEAERVCSGREEVYVLLSGGLDSRIVAGVLHQLKQRGAIQATPVGVTWGLRDSRDVQYAKAAADLLGFGWKHVDLGPEHVMENILRGFPMTGGLVPPCHLHRMLWFEGNVGKDAIVLSGSYGDSIGRAEFSGKHLLELKRLTPYNPLNLMRKEVAAEALVGLESDLASLRERAGPDRPEYGVCEIEQQAHYMRSMLSQVMNVINRWCTVYQMFTDPNVYSFMWSLHPARRDDTVYIALLEDLHPGLARMPWARTNRALHGKTVGAREGLRRQFHDYAGWSSNVLYERIVDLVDPDWFESTGIFDPARVRLLNRAVAPGSKLLTEYGFQLYNMWHWLAAFRALAQSLDSPAFSALAPQPSHERKIPSPRPPELSRLPRPVLPRRLSNLRWLYKAYSLSRRRVAKVRALTKWRAVKR
jgi:asparagine synthase (glutamine-hydrolysing)